MRKLIVMFFSVAGAWLLLPHWWPQLAKNTLTLGTFTISWAACAAIGVGLLCAGLHSKS